MRTRQVVLLTCIALILTLPAYGQFVGPGVGSPKSVDVKSILANPVDDQRVSLKGNILEKIGRDKYTFSDGTAQIRLDIDDKYFPPGAAITPKTLIQISGKVDVEHYKTPEIDVKNIQIIQDGAAPAKTQGR